MNLLKLLFIILLPLIFWNCGQTDNNSNLVEVEQVLATPTEFANQTLVVQGVVSQVNSDKQLFSLISKKEFEECGIADCNASEQLPIRYNGNLPKVGEKIEITGIVKQIQKGFVCEAQSLRNVENL